MASLGSGHHLEVLNLYPGFKIVLNALAALSSLFALLAYTSSKDEAPKVGVQACE